MCSLIPGPAFSVVTDTALAIAIESHFGGMASGRFGFEKSVAE